MSGWAREWMTAAGLSDGRLQFWTNDDHGHMWSTWQDGIDWVYWWQHTATFSAQALGVAPLSDKRLQLWAVDTSGHIWSCWKSTTAADAPWTQWASQWTPQLPNFRATQIAAAPLSDGRVQFWSVDDAGHIWSCWKSTTASSSFWTAWASQWTAAPPPFAAVNVAAAPLSDKRLQFWAVDTTGAIWSCWKSTSASSAPWTAWTRTWTPQPPPFQATRVSAAPLSDGRVQFWAVDTTGAIWSCWKAATGSSSNWTGWTLAWTPDTAAFKAKSVLAAPLADGRLQVWAIDDGRQVRTAFKTTTSSSATWSNWALLFPIVQQEQSNWCWSGCATATGHFFDPSSTWRQCTVANAELGQSTCCSNPGPCNVYGYLDQALGVVGHFQNMTNGTQPDATITAQAKSGLPLGVRVAWSGGGAHFVMVVGGGPNDMVLVKDPIYGMSYITYNTLVNSYRGSGSWTHSYFTK